MNLFPRVLPSPRMLAVLCVFAAAWLARGDQIQFSKPVVPLAAPAKEEKKLSRDRSSGLDFGGSSPEQPYVSQPQIIRVLPRELQEDEEEESDPREPRDLIDPSEKHLRQDSARKVSARERTARNQSRSPETPGAKRPDGFMSEESQSFSPVRDFDLNEREPGQLSANLLFENRSSTNRGYGINRASLASREDSDRQKNGFRPLALFGGPGAGAKEKEKQTREVMEQRAAFEKLINPTMGIAAKTPGSFEPITALEPRSALAVTMPVIGGGKIETKRAEPVQQLGFQQARPPSPVLGDMNKPSTKPAPVPGPSIDPFRQTPLNRQPITREFPARKF